MTRKGHKKILNYEARDVAIAYFCGVDPEFLVEKFGISRALINQCVSGDYMKKPDYTEIADEHVKPEVMAAFNFYKQRSRRNAEPNAINLYFNSGGCKSRYGFVSQDKLPEQERVTLHTFSDASRIVKNQIFNKRIEEILKDTGWANVLNLRNPTSDLLARVFGVGRPYYPVCIDESFDLNLAKQYEQRGRETSLDEVTENTKEQIGKQLLKTGFGYNPQAEHEIKSVLETLTEREQSVLDARFNLSGKYSSAQTLEETGKIFYVTRERIRQIEAISLRKLRHPSRIRRLEEAGLPYNFQIDEVSEVRKIVDEKERQEYERQRERYIAEGRIAESKDLDLMKPIQEMEFSVRAANALNNANISTVGELIDSWDSLPKLRHFGKKSGREIEEALAEMGINMKIDWSLRRSF